MWFLEKMIESRCNEVLSFMMNAFGHHHLLYTIISRNDSLYDQEPVVYKGNGYVEERLEHFRQDWAKSFCSNHLNRRKLYQITRALRSWMAHNPLRSLLRTGSIGIFCSKDAKKIIGVELLMQRCRMQKNALLNNISQRNFLLATLIDVCNDDFFKHMAGPMLSSPIPAAGMHQKLVEKI